MVGAVKHNWVAVPGIEALYHVGQPMVFDTEQQAVEFTALRLRPYCSSLVLEPEIRGLRPDIGFRLTGLEQIPLLVECKKWRRDAISPFPDAVAQASHYVKLTQHAAFVGPFVARSVSCLTQAACRFESGMLVAGQFSVGILWFTPEEVMEEGRVGGLLLAGVNVVEFINDDNGPRTRLHRDAPHLLRQKHRHGSNSWRPILGA